MNVFIPESYLLCDTFIRGVFFMMNYIWVALAVVAVIAGGVTGTMDAVLNNIFEFAETAVDIALGLIGIMAFFCGLMKVMEQAGR